MEENENENENENDNENSHRKKEPNPISMKLLLLLLLSPQADPLFSSIVTLYILILLYLPRMIFLKIIFSPVLIITFTLLLALLRFGATQRNENTELRNNCTAETADDHQATTPPSDPLYSDQDQKWVPCNKVSSFAPNPCFEDSFVEWNVRAPLQVIYEEGEEKEEENAKDDPGNNDDPFLIERYASLSFYYPETDSDDSSDSGGDSLAVGDFGSPESVCLGWEDEDREGLIEIALDHHDDDDDDDDDNNNNSDNKSERLDLGDFHGEEEENNLIEIDISSVRDMK